MEILPRNQEVVFDQNIGGHTHKISTLDTKWSFFKNG